MNDRFKFRYVFEKDFGGKIGICYKMPVFNLDDAVRSVFENKIIEYTNFGYKLIAKNQCTGLKDKNGKLIFEGDIVKYTSLYSGNLTGEVYWDSETLQYKLKLLYSSGEIYADRDLVHFVNKNGLEKVGKEEECQK